MKRGGNTMKIEKLVLSPNSSWHLKKNDLESLFSLPSICNLAWLWLVDGKEILFWQIWYRKDPLRIVIPLYTIYKLFSWLNVALQKFPILSRSKVKPQVTVSSKQDHIIKKWCTQYATSKWGLFFGRNICFFQKKLGSQFENVVSSSIISAPACMYL